MGDTVCVCFRVAHSAVCAVVCASFSFELRPDEMRRVLLLLAILAVCALMSGQSMAHKRANKQSAAGQCSSAWALRRC
jgi:hypothetical protein